MCPSSSSSCIIGKGASNEPFLYHSYETGRGSAHNTAPIPRATGVHTRKNNNGPRCDCKIQTQRFFRHISLSHAEERLNHFHSTFPRPQDPAEASMPFWGCQLGQGVETEQVWGRRGWNMVEGRGNNTLDEGQSRSTGSLCGCLWPPGVPLGIQEAWAWALWPFKLKGKASYLTGCCEGSISARESPQGSPPTIHLLLWLQHLDFLCVL